MRCIKFERRGDRGVAHVDLPSGGVGLIACWKLDAVRCAGLTLGEQRVCLSALSALHEVLVACESRLALSRDGVVAGKETGDGIAHEDGAEPGTGIGEQGVTAVGGAAPPDARLLGLRPAERQAAVKTLARLLLEAEGAAVQEVGDDKP